MKGGISVNAAVINKNAKLQRVPEACADTNWSRNTLMKVAAEANAIIRVGRTVRIDMPEVGEDIGIRAKDDVSSSLAARYAKAYSERMSTVNPEFE